MKLRAILILILPVFPICHGSCVADDETYSAQQIDFFETRIRPLLLTQCIGCHGPDNAESGLRLDSREAILTGGDSGQPAAIAGQPDKSLMVHAIRHNGEPKMPPDNPLNERQTKDLEAWIELGLPWPSNGNVIQTSSAKDRIAEHSQSHWAYQPVSKPVLPNVQSPQLAHSAVDQILLSKLESAGLTFSEIADRRTLIRRATFDLTGMPPGMDEVQEFIESTDPDAFAKLIDRLLASPRYGERWARHWLDVARYSDTRGYTLDNADRNYPFAYTYRDYVIDAFNNDLPYDQFILQQLAADYLEVPADKQTLAALGFLTVGRKYLSRSDTIDDQVDVVTRGLMGMTVSCARCHDHKYDAIPTEDYYSLYGVFDNCHEPDELPLIGKPPQDDASREFLDELKRLKAEVQQHEDEYHQRLQQQMNDYLADYLVRAIAPGDEKLATNLPDVKLKLDQLNAHAITDWRMYLAAKAKHNDPAVIPLRTFFELPAENFVEAAGKILEHWKSNRETIDANAIVLEAILKDPPTSRADLGVTYARLLDSIRKKWIADGSKQPAVEQFEEAEQELARLILSDDSPSRIPASRIVEYFNIAESKEWKKQQSKVDQHHLRTPAGIRRAMTLRENESAHNARIMIRGNETTLGAEVPRQFPGILADQPRKPFANRAGRLELAKAIASADNPLTARVFVNRVWMHHFGKPLVKTPSDFGIRCPKPVQIDLLDYLASEFMSNGWSIKHLHRTMMLTRAYCQSSSDVPEAVIVDPANELIWKMNRRRLEFEAVRDSMLAVSGNLDPAIHGPAVDIFSKPLRNRRTIYGKVDRQDLPNLLRVFDLPNPDQSAAARIRTIVPQQSLFMMNSEFSIQQARTLAARLPLEDTDPETVSAAIDQLYRAVFQRKPGFAEAETGKQFLVSGRDEPESGKLTTWERYVHALLCTNEFVFID